MKLTSTWLMTAMLTLSLMGSACSDDEKSGSSLDANKQVSKLDESEVKVLQSEIEGTVSDLANDDAFVNDLCAYFGVVTAASSFGTMTCEDAVTECKSSVAEETEGQSDAEFAAIAESCDATVGEVTKCVEDTFATLRNVVDGATCESSLEDFSSFSEPASCETVSSKCPGFDDTLPSLE
jgi:hypothetical protein